MIYGYARISDKSQNLGSQIDALKAFGVEKIVKETITGVAPVKDGLDKLVETAVAGDTIIAARLDRLGRSTLQLLNLIDSLDKKGVRFRLLDLPDLDTGGHIGKAIVTIIAALSQLEREQNKIKQRAGIEAAKKRGKHLGREAVGYSSEGLRKALKRFADSRENVNDICEEYNIPRGSLYWHAKKAGIKRT